jgi:hypothetical protein
MYPFEKKGDTPFQIIERFLIENSGG